MYSLCVDLFAIKYWCWLPATIDANLLHSSLHESFHCVVTFLYLNIDVGSPPPLVPIRCVDQFAAWQSKYVVNLTHTVNTQQIIMSNVTSFWYVSKFQPLWQRLKETKILDLYFLILNSSVLCSCSVPKQNKLSPFKNPGSVMGLLQITVISIFVFFSCFLARENSIILGKCRGIFNWLKCGNPEWHVLQIYYGQLCTYSGGRQIKKQ